MTDEIIADIDELKQLRSTSVRPQVQSILDGNILQLNKKLEETKKREEIAKAKIVNQASATSNLLPTIKLATYAYDQSDNFLKLYVTIPAIELASADQIDCQFQRDSFTLLVRNVNKSNYEMTIKGLLFEINPTKSYVKQKKDCALIMLKKVKEGTHWDTVTSMEKSAKDKRAPKMDEKADPQESLMSMMKQMYDDGDDEMKRTIRKSWHESQSKKRQPGGGGDDDFGGMGDF